jgi:hypothetical protein
MAIFNPNQPIEVRRFRYSLILALVLALPMFGIKLMEVVEHLTFARWGIFPRTIIGLRGIIISTVYPWRLDAPLVQLNIVFGVGHGVVLFLQRFVV